MCRSRSGPALTFSHELAWRCLGRGVLGQRGVASTSTEAGRRRLVDAIAASAPRRTGLPALPLQRVVRSSRRRGGFQAPRLGLGWSTLASVTSRRRCEGGSAGTVNRGGRVPYAAVLLACRVRPAADPSVSAGGGGKRRAAAQGRDGARALAARVLWRRGRPRGSRATGTRARRNPNLSRSSTAAASRDSSTAALPAPATLPQPSRHAPTPVQPHNPPSSTR